MGRFQMNGKKENKLYGKLLRHNTLFVVVFQAGLVLGSLILAWLLRFEFTLPYKHLLFSAVPLLILVRLAALAAFNLHHGWWRYTGVGEALDIVKAASSGTLGFLILIRYVLGVTAFPISIYVLETVLTTGLLAGVRLFSRVVAETAREDLAGCRKVVLIGAGCAADMILREIMRPGSGHHALACVDDDRSKRGIRIQGVPVIGSVDELPALISRCPADEVLIAVPSATGAQMQRFVAICERARVKVKTVPALKDIITGQVSIRQLREVNLEDLLGREPARIDLESVRAQIRGRVVMVTGAAGSIGSELCRQILEYDPARLLCVDQNETGIFYLRLELSSDANDSRQVFCVADIRDQARMHTLFAEYAPEVVFHAAAYKHVPIMELNVHEAVENNVFGMLKLLAIAEQAGCGCFVMISSDKAVNPTSVMGATKRIGELILSSRPPNGMRCVSVRFGNVLGSSGSLVPVLQEQLRKNLPLIITHPDAKRFFMTTREAVALVLQAFVIGEHDDILVLDMGKPVRILDLARSLIRLSGKSETEVRIQVTGLRSGEKLCEELFRPTEQVFSTPFDQIKRTGSVFTGWPKLQRHLEELRAAMSQNCANTIRAKIKEIVPEYSYAPAEAPKPTLARAAYASLRKVAGPS